MNRFKTATFATLAASALFSASVYAVPDDGETRAPDCKEGSERLAFFDKFVFEYDFGHPSGKQLVECKLEDKEFGKIVPVKDLIEDNCKVGREHADPRKIGKIEEVGFAAVCVRKENRGRD